MQSHLRLRKNIQILLLIIGLLTVLIGLLMTVISALGDPQPEGMWKKFTILLPTSEGVFFFGLVYLIIVFIIRGLFKQEKRSASGVVLAISVIHLVGFVAVQGLYLYYDATDPVCLLSFLLPVTLDILVIWFTLRFRKLTGLPPDQ